MNKFFFLLTAATIIGCSQSSSTTSTETPINSKFSAEINQQAGKAAGSFYEALKSENYDAVQALLDPASIPNSSWTVALLDDLKLKKESLGVPNSFAMKALQDASDSSRTIYVATYSVIYSKGDTTEENVFLINKETGLKMLDYAY